MMKKNIGIAVVSGLLMMATALPTFAANGAWQHDHRGWRWENTNKSYATSQWIEDKGIWYYLDQDGYMVANSWKEVNGSWYYFLGSGAMASNQWIQDKYYVGASGAMLKNTVTPDGYTVDANGAWNASVPKKNVASTPSGNSQAGPGSSKNTTSAAASSSASTTAAASNTGSKKPSHAYKMNFEGTYIFKSSKQLDESKTPLRLESGKKTMVVSAGEDGALSVNYPTAGTSLKLISTGNNTFKVENDDSTVFRFVGAGVYVTKSNNMEFGYAKR